MSDPKRWAVVESDVVVNVIMLTDDEASVPALEAGQTVVQSDAARIGDSYTAGVFTKTANSK